MENKENYNPLLYNWIKLVCDTPPLQLTCQEFNLLPQWCPALAPQHGQKNSWCGHEQYCPGAKLDHCPRVRQSQYSRILHAHSFDQACCYEVYYKHWKPSLLPWYNGIRCYTLGSSTVSWEYQRHTWRLCKHSRYWMRKSFGSPPLCVLPRTYQSRQP